MLQHLPNLHNNLRDAMKIDRRKKAAQQQNEKDSPAPMLLSSVHNGGVRSVLWVPESDIIISAGDEGIIHIVDIKTATLKASLAGHSGRIWGLAYSKGLRCFASCSKDSSVMIWSEEGKLLHKLQEHKDEVNSVAFSPDGKFLASASDDCTAIVWKLNGTEPPSMVSKLEGHKGWIRFEQQLLFQQQLTVTSIRSVAWNKDSSILATGSGDHSIRLWKLQNWKTPAKVLLGHQSGVRYPQTLCQRDSLRGYRSLAFSPSQNVLISGSFDAHIMVWSEDNDWATPRQTLSGHKAGIWCISFSPSGLQFASAGFDNVIRLWEFHEGHARTKGSPLQGHTRAVSPDGLMIASGSDDETVRLWKMRSKSIAAASKSDSG
eukprot:766000-Hanusia_phi.AAC.7